MTEARPAPLATEAALIAALLAIDLAGLGGVVLRGPPGEVRDAWQAMLRGMLPETMPVRRLPLHVDKERLLGGLDLAASLHAGRRIVQDGVLAEANGGILVVAMAERLEAQTAAHLATALDTRRVPNPEAPIDVERAADFAVVALDEAVGGDDPPSAALLDRLAFHLDLTGLKPEDARGARSRAEIIAARACLAPVTADRAAADALCHAALSLGIVSLRPPILALRAARAAAALAGRDAVAPEDLIVAARLVLAWRATQLPLPAIPDSDAADAGPELDHEPAPDTAIQDAAEKREPPQPDQREPYPQEPGQQQPGQQEIVLDAARAAIPAGLLARLRAEPSRAVRGSAAHGKAGGLRRAQRHGRPIGARPGDPRRGARLHLFATLTAAIPWQPLRRHDRTPLTNGNRINFRRADFRVAHFKDRAETVTIFAVDASGSAALHRLAEAKGAVELLLADCYIRRDQVALLAFRGRSAEIVLPPTRSLARARRCLSALPGGGATPLAAALDAAQRLVEESQRRNRSAVLVLLTDGRANIARDGTPDRRQAETEALEAARALRAQRLRAILIDTSPRPQAQAERLADAMGALYLPLPNADAAALSTAVRRNAGSADARGSAERGSRLRNLGG